MAEVRVEQPISDAQRIIALEVRVSKLEYEAAVLIAIVVSKWPEYKPGLSLPPVSHVEEIRRIEMETDDNAQKE